MNLIGEYSCIRNTLNEKEKLNAVADGLIVSVVSHGHGAQVATLLRQLAHLCGTSVTRVVLTINTPEPDMPPPAPEGGWPFVLEVVRNARPQGFGANHNQGLAGATERFVCVLNPDVALLPEAGDVLSQLCRSAKGARAGMAYPVQIDTSGVRQDSQREIPTPLSLLQRRLLGRVQQRTDWVNAACIVLPGKVWHAMEGFDERFFMYCEDVDLCLRVQLAGWSLVASSACIIHAGQRASSRRWAHLKWHLQSLWLLWRTPAYNEAHRRLRNLGRIA